MGYTDPLRLSNYLLASAKPDQAIYAGRIQIVRLLDAGEDLNVAENAGWAPQINAAYVSDIPGIQLLLKRRGRRPGLSRSSFFHCMLFPVDPPNEASATSDVKQELSSEQQSELARLSREPFGHTLARQVAHHLKKRGAIAYNHRDYCGTGLFYLNGEYLHTVVDDGHPVPYYGQDRGWSFEDQHAFVAWLGEQSDYSLSMHDNPGIFNNQTITRKRLEETLSTTRDK